MPSVAQDAEAVIKPAAAMQVHSVVRSQTFDALITTTTRSTRHGSDLEHPSVFHIHPNSRPNQTDEVPIALTPRGRKLFLDRF